MSSIPYFHFTAPSEKLKSSWCMKAVGWCYYNTDNRSLLFGKNLKNIEEYASGEFDMKPYKRMFKSIKKAIDEQRGMGTDINENAVNAVDHTGLDWTCLPLIPTKLNSAVSVIQKVPIEVYCRALDALAMKKKNDDITFLKNKGTIEAELQDFADQMQIGKVDLGTTKNSFKKYDNTPYGLNLNDPDEEDIFTKLIYALGAEVAFEKALQQFYEILNGLQVKLLEIKDQFKYGISVHRALTGGITGLPDVEYVFPGDVDTPHSDLPDYSDNTHRITHKPMTVLEMFNYFGDEIGSEDDLEKIVNEKDTGYCYCNKGVTTKVDPKHFGSFKLQLKYIEIKSIDWVGIVEKKNSIRGAKEFTEDENKATKKVWAQNTYGFYWLVGTEHVFGIHRLSYSHRTNGNESYQNFSTNIYKTQVKSAVELSIGENKKAQVAELKLQYALIKSLPNGMYFDLKYMRNAVNGLKDMKDKYTIQSLVNLLMERNTFIGDTEGFDSKNDGQHKPFMEIPGGLRTEVQGYLQIIADASLKISQYTGINEALTGQSPDPDSLVGLQKLYINQGLNALYYCTEAVKVQYQKLFNILASLLQAAIERGGKTKEAIINMIGVKDTEILDNLNDTPLHHLTIKIEIGQREEERAIYQQRLQKLMERGVLTIADEYVLNSIDNTKERIAYLAVKEKRAQKEAEKVRAEQYASQQELMKQQGQNMLQAKGAEVDGQIQVVYAKGEVESKLMTLAAQLGFNKQQQEALVKKMLQRDRGVDQTNKAINTLQAKAKIENQKALV
jgi:hypothetical protein